ncbi:hypothetical protein BY996DRAFT_6427910 [Phakopsora pachyrhizi]|nr:hypothetical protein BY996DRAFT_6427910 [Phakopsora pachyrhizi]
MTFDHPQPVQSDQFEFITTPQRISLINFLLLHQSSSDVDLIFGPLWMFIALTNFADLNINANSWLMLPVPYHPDVTIIERSLSPPCLSKCEDSLKQHGIEPLTLGPKERLAICNGTAYSASAVGVAIHQAHVLALLSEVVTAMTVEALQGRIGAFHP